MLDQLLGIDPKQINSAVAAAEKLSSDIQCIRKELEKQTTLLQQIKDKVSK